MIPDQHTIEAVAVPVSKASPPKAARLVFALLVFVAMGQVAMDLLYGCSLGIYWDVQEGPKLQADYHAGFHNMALLSTLAATFVVAWLLEHLTNA